MEYSRTSRRRRRRARRLGRLAIGICLFCAAGLIIYFVADTLIKQLQPAQNEPALTYNPAPAYSPAPAAQGGADGGLLAQLSGRLSNHPALAPVVENPAQYPESLMNLFLVNPDVLDTLLAYPGHDASARGAVAQDDVAGGFPRLMQWDTRWAYLPYGDDMMAVTGCGPTCLAAVAVHLTGDLHCGPAEVASYAEKNGYYIPGTGSTWALMTEGAAGLGLSSEELPLDEGAIFGALREGKPVICSMGQGDFTTGAGHFVVLTSVDEGGNIGIHDPARTENGARTWRYDEIAHQVKNLWALSAR